MKFSTSFTMGITLAFVLMFQKSFAESENYIPNYYEPVVKQAEVKKLGVENLVPVSNKSYSSQQANWVLWDSIANLYSYFNSGTNDSYIYSAEYNKLVFIKRGFHNFALEPSYTGTNTLNNLLIRSSGDMGKEWTENVLVFNAIGANLGRNARYPNVDLINYQGAETYIFNGPLTGGTGWIGMIHGIEQSGEKFDAFIPEPMSFDGISTDAPVSSRLISNVTKANQDNFFHLIAAPIAPKFSDEFSRSHIGLQKFVDLSPIASTIPPQWSSSKFHLVQNEGFRGNEIVGMKKISNGDIYFVANGNFNVGARTGARPGISISKDEGDTWTEFDVFPFEVRDAFMNQNYPGFAMDSVFFNYSSKDFVVFEDGEVVLAVQMIALNGPNSKRMFVELNWKNGNWTMYPIAEWTGFTLVYSDIRQATSPGSFDSTSVNPNDCELQIAKTVDEQALMVKWIDLVGLDQVMGQFETSDVFVSARRRNRIQWSLPENVTESEEIDRAVVIPDVVPNGLKDVPFIKSYTRFTDPATERSRQFMSIEPQDMLIAYVNLDFDSVEEQNMLSENTSSVYPNPANTTSTLSYTLVNDAFVKVQIFDMFGNTIQTLTQEHQTAGMRYAHIDATGLPVGTYYIAIDANGNRNVEKLVVVR